MGERKRLAVNMIANIIAFGVQFGVSFVLTDKARFFVHFGFGLR